MNPVNRSHHHLGHRRGVALATALSFALGTVACAGDSSTGTGLGDLSATTTSSTEPPTSSPEPTTTIAEPATTTTTPPATTTATEQDSTLAVSLDARLSEDELAGLLWMREEEQLAHDVYTTLGDMWDLRIFDNISASERTHIDLARSVFDQYDLVDPAADNELGTFTDPQIQALYDQLVADGSASLTAALEVGALIEELDISDLRARAAATDNADLTTLYAQLERGSRNHLRAFTSQLELRDVVYEPTQLDAAAYEEIVTSPSERGRDG